MCVRALKIEAPHPSVFLSRGGWRRRGCYSWFLVSLRLCRSCSTIPFLFVFNDSSKDRQLDARKVLRLVQAACLIKAVERLVDGCSVLDERV